MLKNKANKNVKVYNNNNRIGTINNFDSLKKTLENNENANIINNPKD